MAITENLGTLNVAEHINIGRDGNIRGNLTVIGDLRVEGITTLLNPVGLSSGDGSGDSSGTTAQLEALRASVEEERKQRQNADTTLNTSIGMVRMDAASAQNIARQSTTRSEEAAQMATDAAAAAELVRIRMEESVAGMRREYDYWIFPTPGGEEAVSSDGVCAVTFAKEGFRLRCGGVSYKIAPPLSSPFGLRFMEGESGWLAINMGRLLRSDGVQSVSTAQVMEKITDPAALSPGSHIPVACCSGGKRLRLAPRFAAVFG